MQKLVVDLSIVDRRDIHLVGNYASELGEMSRIDIPIPQGFVITTNCFREFLTFNKLYSLSSDETKVKHGVFPTHMAKLIYIAYKKLENIFKDAHVIVTPSSPFTDQSVHKNVHFELKGDANLMHKILDIWAKQFNKLSLLSTKALEFGNITRLDIAIVVQKKLDLKKSGKIFTEDPITSDKSKIVIEQTGFDHTQYIVSKKDYKVLFRSHQSRLGKSHILSHYQVRILSHFGIILQRHFYFPQEITFTIDKNKIYILETKPMIHQLSNLQTNSKSNFESPSVSSHQFHPTNISHLKKNILLRGENLFPGIVTGPVRVIKNPKFLHSINPSEILVVPKIDQIQYPLIKKAKGLISENNTLTDKDKMIYRKFVARPTLQGVKNATILLHTGKVITLNSTKGEIHFGGLH